MRSDIVTSIFWLLVIAIVAPFIWWSWTSDVTNPPKAEISPEDNKKGEARYACKQAIAKSLHSPDSAEWGISSDNWFQSWPASVDGDVVTVRPEFRASNAMGATILTSWMCKISITKEIWTFLDLKEL